ncbi:MAG TPA: HEAT repeat domain-containing protein [Kofleriaceae bacterium]|nr:HEAT repeat domain-containing protein [Kofleriaceae bacterium]
MSPTNRWKLVSFVLAGALTYSWWHGDAHSQVRARSVQARKGPVHVSAAALGVSVDDLVRQMFAAKTAEDMQPIAEKLGMVGDDAVIDALLPLVEDSREGVPSVVLGVFGSIATDHAVEVLTKAAGNSRDDIHQSAIAALGATHNPRAEELLIEVAQKTSDSAQTTAIDALADIASDRAIEVLAKIAGHTTDSAVAAVRSLARIEKPAAKAALLALVDSPSLTVAATAIGELKDIDAAMVQKLVTIVKDGDRELVTAAIGALARAGEAGLPALREAALEGAMDVRVSAMNAMASIDNPQVLETLRSILENEDGRAADAAAAALANIDSDEAREALISAALSEHPTTSRAVEYLMRQSGPEVEQALLVIAKSDSQERWEAVTHLVQGGNAEALALAVGQARGGADDTVKIAAMEALADSGNAAALESLIDVVRGSGDLKARAIGILGDAKPDDPVVGKLLRDSVQSRDPDEAAAAAAALAKVGTPEARDALVAALGSTDGQVARNAMSSLSKFRLTDDTTAAMRTALVSHPELKSQVMQQLLSGGSPYGLELAKDALTNGDAQDAYRAMSALEQAASPAAFDVLMQGVRNGDAQVRAEAVATVGNMGDKRGADVLAQALRDSDAYVRQTAARTLANSGTQQARELIVGMSRSQDVDDRRAAVQNLRRFEDDTTTGRLTELIRDPDWNVAYTAIDTAADRPGALAALRGMISDVNIPTYQRRETARLLSYRGVNDPMIESLLSSSDYE